VGVAVLLKSYTIGERVKSTDRNFKRYNENHQAQTIISRRFDWPILSFQCKSLILEESGPKTRVLKKSRLKSLFLWILQAWTTVFQRFRLKLLRITIRVQRRRKNHQIYQLLLKNSGFEWEIPLKANIPCQKHGNLFIQRIRLLRSQRLGFSV